MTAHPPRPYAARLPGWPLRLAVRTSPSHGENTSSILVGVTSVLLASTGHDRRAAADFRLLIDRGIGTAHDGLRWHRIEDVPGRYRFDDFVEMLAAANATGMQMIWDLMHFGWPDHLDFWSPAFVAAFAAFARRAAEVHRSQIDAIPCWVPVNEISFLSWTGGEIGFLNPFACGRGTPGALRLPA